MEYIATRNIRIHGRINFIAGVVFLVPIISIFYKYTGLSLFEIILVSNVFTFGMWLFELPTSVLADTTGRKRCLVYSVIANLLSAICILVYPTFIGFGIAAVFQALYYSFRSGTGQAFLQENLRVLNKEEKFGQVIGGFMFYEQAASILTPLIAGLVLKTYGDIGYTLLAVGDVFFAIVLVILTLQVTETTEIHHKFITYKHALHENIRTAKQAIQEVFGSAKVRLFMIYRSLSHHILFFGVILLPVLSEKGMEDWISGVIQSIFILGAMFASKYAYKFGEKYGYTSPRIRSTVAQAFCLIGAGLLFESWILVAVFYFLFSVFDGLIAPSWNHVLVQLTKGNTLATTRSIIFSIFALYMTIGKRLLSYISPDTALIFLGFIILLSNIFLGKRMLNITK